jgi:hypothetical protein
MKSWTMPLHWGQAVQILPEGVLRVGESHRVEASVALDPGELRRVAKRLNKVADYLDDGKMPR